MDASSFSSLDPRTMIARNAQDQLRGADRPIPRNLSRKPAMVETFTPCGEFVCSSIARGGGEDEVSRRERMWFFCDGSEEMVFQGPILEFMIGSNIRRSVG